MRENLEKDMTGKFAETDADFLKIVCKLLVESNKIFSNNEDYDCRYQQKNTNIFVRSARNIS